MVIKVVFSEVKFVNMLINGGDMSKLIFDIYVVKVILLVVFILGNWLIKDIVSGNIMDMFNLMKEKFNIVKVMEWMDIINMIFIIDNVILYFNVVNFLNLFV